VGCERGVYVQSVCVRACVCGREWGGESVGCMRWEYVEWIGWRPLEPPLPYVCKGIAEEHCEEHCGLVRGAGSVVQAVSRPTLGGLRGDDRD
jgi:hypothetical protein